MKRKIKSFILYLSNFKGTVQVKIIIHSHNNLAKTKFLENIEIKKKIQPVFKNMSNNNDFLGMLNLSSCHIFLTQNKVTLKSV